MDSLHDLIGRIYESAVHPNGLAEATEEIAREFDALASWFYVMSPASDDVYVANEATGFDDTAVEQYRDRMWQLDYAVQAALTPGKTFETHELISPRQRQADEFARWKKESAGSNRLIGRSATSPDGLVTGLTLHFPNDLKRRRSERRRFETIMPHFSRSFQLAGRIAEAQAATVDAMVAVELFRQAAAVLDRSGRIIWMNDAARKILSRGDGVTVRDGKLSAVHTGQDASIRSSYRRLLVGHRADFPPTDAVINLPRANKTRPYGLELFVAPPAIKHFIGSSVAILAIIHDPDEHRQPHAELWREMFGLTEAEARVADGLRLGKPDEDIASVLGVKVSTVRSHIKMILAKTETRTKAEAAHLLTLLSA